MSDGWEAQLARDATRNDPPERSGLEEASPHYLGHRERLRTRVKAYEDGQWFRDALVVHADKHAAPRPAAA